MLRRVESLPKLRHIVAQSIWHHATDHDYLSELTSWSGRYASLAGVLSAQYSAVGPHRSDTRATLCRPGVGATGRYSVAEDDAAVVLALGTKDDSQLSRLRAGEATSSCC